MVQKEQEPRSFGTSAAAAGRGGTEGWLPPEYPGSLSGHRYLLIIISIGKLAWCIFQPRSLSRIARPSACPTLHAAVPFFVSEGLGGREERKVGRRIASGYRALRWTKDESFPQLLQRSAAPRADDRVPFSLSLSLSLSHTF